MSKSNEIIDSKVAFALSTNKTKRSRIEPSSAAFEFHNDDDDKTKGQLRAEAEHHRRSSHAEPMVIPLPENDKTTLLERRMRMTADELAAEALNQSAVARVSGIGMTTPISGTTNFSSTGNLIIASDHSTNLAATASSNDINNDKEAYLKDLERLPDEADDEAYDRVPVSEFGAALLRGMGWTDGDASSSKAPPPIVMRPHRLGLGATPKILLPNAIPGKLRTQDQVKRDEKLRKQQEGFEKERKARVAQDKQQTLQIGSLVYCQGRRAKAIQLNGVPGLNRVFVQFEQETTVTNVMKGALTLISRPDLDKLPFRDTELNNSEVSRPKPVLAGEHERGPDIVRSKQNEGVGGRKRGIEGNHREMVSTRRQEREERGWIIPNIRVRVITKKLGADQFKEKGVVLDVYHVRSMATIHMSNGQVLDRVPERYLETALPKVGGKVIVLAGQSKFAKGTLLERDSKAGRGVVQVFEDMHIMKLSLDHLAEWVGPLDDDMMD